MNSQGNSKILVVFVCTGNSCRSVMAEYLLKKMLNNDEIEIVSAGTSTIDGLSPTPETIKVMKEKEGIDVSQHRATQLTKELIEKADYIYVMTEAHKNWISCIDVNERNKVKLLKKYGIGDPLGSSQAGYEKCLMDIKKAVADIANDISKKHK